jgi:hypothetical protein
MQRARALGAHDEQRASSPSNSVLYALLEELDGPPTTLKPMRAYRSPGNGMQPILDLVV